MTTPPQVAKSGRRWLRYPAWVSASPYRKAGIFAAILLLGVPMLLRLILGVPFATTFTLMAFVCIMQLLLAAWPRNPETGKRLRRWLVPFAYVFGFMLFIGAWATQPHFGANVCLLKGFMWDSDFVEEIRPKLHSIVQLDLNWHQNNGEFPLNVNKANIMNVLDGAVDEMKRCVRERSVEFCRYIGPNKDGVMMTARTIEGPNAILEKDEYKYRYLKPNSNFEFSIIPKTAGGSKFSLKLLTGSKFETGGVICDPGCYCDVTYGR